MPKLFLFPRCALMLLAGLALAGCGRRGALEEPPDPADVAQKQQAQPGVEAPTPRPAGRRRSGPPKPLLRETPLDFLL